ncbi:MAG: serine hydrolase [Myxococcota bacterium]|nr:serine hydrolase [Myxococcota bacterium]
MKNFDRIRQKGVAAGAAPGASATVLDRSGIIWEGAARERSLGSDVAMTIGTVGAIHSMTKAITGAAAIQNCGPPARSIREPVGKTKGDSEKRWQDSSSPAQ